MEISGMNFRTVRVRRVTSEEALRMSVGDELLVQ